jgi:hypothetical protein
MVAQHEGLMDEMTPALSRILHRAPRSAAPGRRIL